MRGTGRPARRQHVLVGLGVAVLVLVGAACGGGVTPSAQQLGGPATADLERAWDVQLVVEQVEPSGLEAPPDRERRYRFERGECPDQVTVEPDEGATAPIDAEDVRVETDPEACLGTASIAVEGGTVSGVPFVQVDDTTFRMSYEARIACVDDAGEVVEGLGQSHELLWEVDARDAPTELTGELVQTVRTDPGCAPRAGQARSTTSSLVGTPVEQPG